MPPRQSRGYSRLISFDCLSSEYRTSRRDGYALLVVGGQPGAQCEYVGRSKKCSSSLEMLLLDNGMAPHELDLAARALRYIFSNAVSYTHLTLPTNREV